MFTIDDMCRIHIKNNSNCW